MAYINNRGTLLTKRTSKQLSELDPFIKANSFFSAQVAKAKIAERLRAVSDLVSNGQMTVSAGVTELRTWLRGEGYTPDAPGSEPPPGWSKEQWIEAKKIENLASTARLNLILTQNKRQAQAVAKYAEGMDPDIMEAFPAWRYRSQSDGRVRSGHSYYDGMIFAKTDPIWRRIFPPWEFGCRCWVEEVSAKEWAEYQTKSRSKVAIPPRPESGYEFDPAEAFKLGDAGSLEPVSRSDIVQTMQKAVTDGRIDKFGVIMQPPTDNLKKLPVDGADDAVRAFRAAQASAKASTLEVAPDAHKFARNHQLINELYDDAGVDSDKIPAAVLDKLPAKIALGTLPERFAVLPQLGGATVNLSTGNWRSGITHLWRNHKEFFLDPPRLEKLLQSTLGDPGCRVVVSFMPVARSGTRRCVTRLAVNNPKDGSYLILELPEDGNDLQIVSGNFAPESYGTEQWSIKKK